LPSTADFQWRIISIAYRIA